MQLVIKSIHIDHEFLQYGMKISGQKERAFLNHRINIRNLSCGEKSFVLFFYSSSYLQENDYVTFNIADMKFNTMCCTPSCPPTHQYCIHCPYGFFSPHHQLAILSTQGQVSQWWMGDAVNHPAGLFTLWISASIWTVSWNMPFSIFCWLLCRHSPCLFWNKTRRLHLPHCPENVHHRGTR